MRVRVTAITAFTILLLVAPASRADLSSYSQDFESLVQTDGGALANDGWLVFGNAFDGDWNYQYGYGVFPAPNPGGGFSAIDAGQGGPAQGNQQLAVYSDYNNGDHANGYFIEANVFQEQWIGAVDAGSTWRFEFDAKRGNIEGLSVARAFFKTLDPNAGYALTNFLWVDTTNLPDAWGSYSLDIYIDPALAGQILQFGFLATATLYQGSGNFYDNVSFGPAPVGVELDIRPGGCPNPFNGRSQGLVPVAVLGTTGFDVNTIDVASLQLEGVEPINSHYEDVATPYTGNGCGCTEDGPDGLTDLTLKFRNQELVDALGPAQPGDRVLTLTGTLLDGTPIEGHDCIVFVGGGSRTHLQSEAAAGDNPVVSEQFSNINSEATVSSGTTRNGVVRKPTSRRRGD